MTAGPACVTVSFQFRSAQRHCGVFRTLWASVKTWTLSFPEARSVLVSAPLPLQPLKYTHIHTHTHIYKLLPCWSRLHKTAGNGVCEKNTQSLLKMYHCYPPLYKPVQFILYVSMFHMLLMKFTLCKKKKNSQWSEGLWKKSIF